MLFITIVTGIVLGMLIGGFFINKLFLEPREERLRTLLSDSLSHAKQELIATMEEQYTLLHGLIQRDKAELNDALKHTLEELLITLQTIKAYPETDEVRKQEIFEWAIRKTVQRMNASEEKTSKKVIALLEHLVEVASTPTVEKPVAERKTRKTSTGTKSATKRERKPRTAVVKDTTPAKTE